MVTQARLKELLKYSPASGEFVWRASRGGVLAGSVAGYVRPDGYIEIRINGKSHLSHRLVFVYQHGEFPPDAVDHINGTRTDNRRINLRRCDDATNQKNMSLYSTNTSGVVGISWDKRTSKWAAYISINSVQKNLGLFEDRDRAEAARTAAEIEYGFHKNHGRKKQC